MTTISIVRENRPAGVWASVFPVTRLRPEIAGDFIFEIFERDGKYLQRDLNQKHLLSADGGQVFWGELVSLTPCTSTVPGLALMRDRTTLRGILRIYPDTVTAVN
jgi:hypothetical protein